MQSTRLGQIETAIAIGLWAVSFPLIKLVLQDVSPITLIMIRFSLGGMLLAVLAGYQKLWRALKWRDLPAIAGLGLVGVALHQMLQVTGQALTAAGVAAFLASTAPLFIVVFGAIFLNERLRMLQIAGVLVATAGAIIVSSGGQNNWLPRSQLLDRGSLLMLASAVVWALYSIVNRMVGRKYPALVTASGMMLAGVLICTPLWIEQKGWVELVDIPTKTWINLLVIGIFCTGIAHLIYTHALKRTPASALAAVQNIEPVIAVIAAGILLREPFYPALITGGIFILVGVYLAEIPSKAQMIIRKSNPEGENPLD